MKDALISFQNGEIHQPLRFIVKPPKAPGVLGLMPAYNCADGSLGIKVVSVFPGNRSKGKDAHQGAVLLFSGETGEVAGVFNASAITAIRTAAVSAVATDVLAREDACVLAVIGAGVQAEAHVAAIANVRPLTHVRIASRSNTQALALREKLKKNHAIEIEVAEDIQKALEGADIIVTATTSREPVLKREWIPRGAHINAVGSSTGRAREIDTATVKDANLFVDSILSAENEAGDYLVPLQEGEITRGHIRGELGAVLCGKIEGRRSRDEITLFKSVGIAAEDLAAAVYLYDEALRQKAGTIVDL